MTTRSTNGRWELRVTDDYELNVAGYGNGQSRYELVELATGHVVRTWSGVHQTAPWNDDVFGVSSVDWDGDTLVIIENGVERRESPAAS